MRIGSIVIHCQRFDEMLDFWQRALGYVPRANFVVLEDPDGNLFCVVQKDQ